MIKENLPNHVAIIMDGNGRWAIKKRLPTAAWAVKRAKGGCRPGCALQRE